MHWTTAQTWTNRATGESVTAGELIDRYDRYLRVNRVSLCCATSDVRMSDNTVWSRDKDQTPLAIVRCYSPNGTPTTVVTCYSAAAIVNAVARANGADAIRITNVKGGN